MPISLSRRLFETAHASEDIGRDAIGNEEIRMVESLVSPNFVIENASSSSSFRCRQCASCVNAQQEELDQRNVNVDAPRQIRPRRTNELVLRESVIKVRDSLTKTRTVTRLDHCSSARVSVRTTPRIVTKQRQTRKKRKQRPINQIQHRKQLVVRRRHRHPKKSSVRSEMKSKRVPVKVVRQ